MSYVLTLVSAQNSLPCDEVLPYLNVLSSWDVLATDRAAEIVIKNIPSVEDLRSIRALCDGVHTDVFLTPTFHRRKSLLLADMDSTIVEGETLDDLAAYAGLKDQISAITARAMNGELDFHTALRERVGLLSGLSADMLRETLGETRLNVGAERLVRTMKTHGARCVLVSGGFTFFTGAIADQVGFDHHHGNVLDIAAGQLTGAVQEPILDKDAKLVFLKDYADQLSMNLSQAMTIGDGANDLPMLLAAEKAGGLGMGYDAKPSVAEQLVNVIRYNDLTAALYAQGYRADEIVD